MDGQSFSTHLTLGGSSTKVLFAGYHRSAKATTTLAADRIHRLVVVRTHQAISLFSSTTIHKGFVWDGLSKCGQMKWTGFRSSLRIWRCVRPSDGFQAAIQPVIVLIRSLFAVESGQASMTWSSWVVTFETSNSALVGYFFLRNVVLAPHATGLNLQTCYWKQNYQAFGSGWVDADLFIRIA